TVTPDFEAGCPRWLTFLSEGFAGDDEIVGCVQRLIGYCLTGSTREEILPIFTGSGGNGQGTLIRTLMHVLGEYAAALPAGALIAKRTTEHPTEIAMLHKVRLAVSSENPSGARLNISRVKDWTGGDKLRGRWMNKDFFEFSPTHK